MKLIKKLIAAFYRPFVAKKIYRSSFYTWGNIQLHIPPGVFHPKFFYSTKFLLQTVLNNSIQGKTLLELGAGSGLISIASAKAGAIVTATDISKRVMDALAENARRNGVVIEMIHSDLFDQLPSFAWDMIAINPPYYPKNPRNELEKAWYCGEGFEYFEKLFGQLKGYAHHEGVIWMVLSEDCNLEKIFSIAEKNGFTLNQVEKKRFWWEWNMIYKIQRSEPAPPAY